GGVGRGSCGRGGWGARRDWGRAAAGAGAAFDGRGRRGPRQKVALLSGGNAQKIVLAREFSRAPAVVVAHSPSRGLDARACAVVHERLMAARGRGAGGLLIREELGGILNLSGRIGGCQRGPD